jgi:hypothetical protein
MARCLCKRTEPSALELPFFEFRGEGSRAATDLCKHCGYALVAHTAEVMARNKALKCTSFESHGAWEFDLYYCGCRGWD